MQNPVRDRLESAALRLDDFLNSSVASNLGPHERTVLSAVNDIAQAIEMLAVFHAVQRGRNSLKSPKIRSTFGCPFCPSPAQAKLAQNS